VPLRYAENLQIYASDFQEESPPGHGDKGKKHTKPEKGPYIKHTSEDNSRVMVARTWKNARENKNL